MKDNFNVAIIGAGSIAQKMARTINGMDTANTYAIASRDLDRAKDYQQQFGFKKAFGSYEEMLKDPDIDLVYIATPHSHHAEQAIMCLEAGKPVLCEKAFTVNAEQAKKVLAKSKETGLYVGEAIWPRYMPMRKILCDLVNSGELGNPLSLTANLGYNVINNGPRLSEPALAGGALLDVGVYALNFAATVFTGEVSKITATAQMHPKGVDQSGQVMIEFADGKIATTHDSIVYYTDRRGVVSLDGGYIMVNDTDNYTHLTAYRVEKQKDYLYKDIDLPHKITGFEYEVQSAIDAINAGKIESPEMPHSEIIKMMSWMDAVREQIGLKYPCE